LRVFMFVNFVYFEIACITGLIMNFRASYGMNQWCSIHAQNVEFMYNWSD